MKEETFAYFAVVGEGDHNRITEIIGVNPTEAFTGGAMIPGRNVSYGSTSWILESTLDRNRPLHDCLEEHIENVISKAETFKDKLEQLRPDYDLFIQCVARYLGWNLGFNLSSGLLRRVANLGLFIDFDLYSLSENEMDAKQDSTPGR